MKKSELKQIIKEEVEKTLNEATIKLGPNKTVILKSDKKGVWITKLDSNDGYRVHSQMYIFKDEIPDVIAFLNSIK
jgi:hypothetical protein